NPACLRAREVGRQRQARLRTEAVLAAATRQLVDDAVGPRVLPHDGVVDGLAGRAVPQEGRFALVCDPDRGDLPAFDTAPDQSALDHFLGALPDLLRVVLDPARPWIDLLMLLLVRGDDVPAMVEQHAAGACCALVDGRDV